MNSNKFIHECYEKLLLTFPDRPWEKTVIDNNKQKNLNNSVEYSVNFGLYLYRNPCIYEFDIYEENIIQISIILQNNIFNMMQSLQGMAKDRFRSRWHAAFQHKDNMRALMFEATIYNELIKQNLTVDHDEQNRNDGTYDFLVSNYSHEWAIECKSFSFDKALILSSEDANRIQKNIHSLELNVSTQTKKQLAIIDLTIKAPIPKEENKIDEFFKEVINEIENRNSHKSKEFDIKITYLDDVEHIEKDLRYIDIPKSDNIEILSIMSPPDGENSRFLLRLLTVMKHNFWQEFKKITRDAAKKQLTDKKNSVLDIQIVNTDSLIFILNSEEFRKFLDMIFSYRHIKEVNIFHFPRAIAINASPFIDVDIALIGRFINTKFPQNV